jgi:hypothetical protein
MRIAFIHDNQNTPDGVATVIRNNIKGVQQLLRPHGIKPRFHLIGATGHVNLDHLPDLDKDLLLFSGVDHLKTKIGEVAEAEITGLAEKTCRQILKAVANDDIIVYENPLIGYWPVALEALDLLKTLLPARYPGKDLVCRVHDVAEERPGTVMPFLNARYGQGSQRLRSLLYPSGLNLVTMTGRFVQRFRALNPAASMTFLPNSVCFPAGITDDRNASVLKTLGLGVLDNGRPARVIVYPVRSMPRKCVEEAVLLIEALNRLFPDAGPFQLGLPLTGSKILKSYQPQVVDLLQESGTRYVKYLPFEIGTMTEPGMYDLINASCATITTSRLEGFGYAYVEPFAVGRGKPVFGRRLDVCRLEFEPKGLDYRGLLYDRLDFAGQDLSTIGDLKEKFTLIAGILKDGSLLQRFIAENSSFFERLEGLFLLDPAYFATNRAVIEREYSPFEVARQFLADTRLKNNLRSIIGDKNAD